MIAFHTIRPSRTTWGRKLFKCDNCCFDIDRDVTGQGTCAVKLSIYFMFSSGMLRVSAHLLQEI
jgi:hypothetical protein